MARKKQEGPVGIRLEPDVKAALERAAEANNRSLHGELVYRLKASVLPENEFDAALGEVMATLTGLVDLTLRPTSGKERLAMLRAVFNGVIEQLGADAVQLTDERKALARQLGLSMGSVDESNIPNRAELQPTLGSVARLKYTIAEMDSRLKPITRQSRHKAAYKAMRAKKGEGD